MHLIVGPAPVIITDPAERLGKVREYFAATIQHEADQGRDMRFDPEGLAVIASPDWTFRAEDVMAQLAASLRRRHGIILGALKAETTERVIIQLIITNN